MAGTRDLVVAEAAYVTLLVQPIFVIHGRRVAGLYRLLDAEDTIKPTPVTWMAHFSMR